MSIVVGIGEQESAVGSTPNFTFFCAIFFPFDIVGLPQDCYGPLPTIKGQILPRSAPIKFRPHAIADRMTL